MIEVVNDVSFQETYGTIELAEQGMNQFLDICKQIETNEITNVHEIRTGLIDTQVIIAPSYKLIQLLQGFREREERTLLISILTNRGTYKTDEGDTCEINGKTSYVCAQGIDNFLISLLSNCVFASPILEGIIKGEKVEIRNLSQKEHIDFYRNELGIRKYVANDKKHKFDRENFYGKGKVGSRMDLDDEEAQELLNKAIYIKGRLYGKKNGAYYAFQKERDVYYHAYRADDLGEDKKNILDKNFSRE